MHTGNKLVLTNKGIVPCLRKQEEPLILLELTSDRHPHVTSQYKSKGQNFVVSNFVRVHRI